MVSVQTKIIHACFPNMMRQMYTKSRMIFIAIIILFIVSLTGLIIGSIALAGRHEATVYIPLEKVVVIDNQEYIPLHAL